MDSPACEQPQRQRYGVLQRSFHARFATRAAGSWPGFLPQPRGSGARSVGAAPASRCAQTETSTTSTEPHRSAVVDLAPTSLATMEGCSGHCETGDRHRLASVVLANSDLTDTLRVVSH